MRKTFSLFRASLSEGMNFFRISGKKQSKFSRIGVPIIVGIIFVFVMASYGEMMMEPLSEIGMEFVVLTLFVVFSAIFTLMEGIYKSSGLLFGCRDDNIVFSLPIKKSTVLLIRVLKFYLFEIIINALILAPVMVVYGIKVGAPVSFYLVSVVALLILPILPVVISCVVGGLISYFSTRFKFRNLVQIVLTMLVLVVVLFVSFKLHDIMQAIMQNAESINEIITRLYYPAGEYIGLVLDFNFWNFLIFIVVNAGLFLLMIIALGRIYYKINSRVKIVKNDAKKYDYKTNKHRPIIALTKKEINKFVSSPVFVINAGFGLVLFIVSCVLISVKIDVVLNMMAEMGFEMPPVDQLLNFMPAILFGLVFTMSMMTSITSSMISLEGKSFNILKSLPASVMMIILAKVLAAVIVMVPIFLVGDLIMFARFDFDVWQILMILAASVIMPVVAELVGIIVNLKYPKMDAKDDVEVVKQSMSSMIAVFIGMMTSGMMIYIIYNAFVSEISVTAIIGAGLMFSIIILTVLLLYLRKWGVKDFNAINV